MLLSQATRAFQDSRIGVYSDATHGWYETRLGSLREFLGDVEIGSIETDDLRRWRTSLIHRERRWSDHPFRPESNGGLSPHTIHGYVRAVRTFFRWLEDEGRLDKNPARRLELPATPKNEPRKDIDEADARRIIDAARDNARDHAILRFLADTGCRAEGIVELSLPDLHLDKPDSRGQCWAVVREKCKGGQFKARVVYFDTDTTQALRRYLDERPDVESDRVFLGKQRGRPYKPLEYSGVYQMIERYARRLGINGRWNPHAWRHRFAHGILDAGGDLALLSQLMGHSGIKVTAESYSTRPNRVLAEHHARYSWLSKSDD
jgi:integrase/recombinase XerD